MTVGKEGISAKIIADSISKFNRITTFELEYPRMIHSELMTHRMISKNCASSRAIPVAKMLDQIRNNPAMPVWWGKNQAGMQAAVELTGEALDMAKERWLNAASDAANLAEIIMEESDLHKQITNRITEPWQRMKTVATGTEWANLLWLRDHKDAQPEFAELAKCIREEFEASKPMVLMPGEWHVPYVQTAMADAPDGEDSEWSYWSDEGRITLDQALKLSVSLCCQVSYRRGDTTLEKAIAITEKLCIPGQPGHFSPFEHQATPMDSQRPFLKWQEGISHQDRNGNFWSGNFKGWIQNRKIIESTSTV